MTDTTIETTETNNTTTDSQAEYEALREAQFDEPNETAEESEEGSDPAEEGEPQKQEAPDVEKLQKSLRERSGAARQAREEARQAREELAALRAEFEALKGGKQDDPLAALKDDDSDPIGDLEALKRIVKGMAKAGDQEKAQRAQATQQQQNVKQLSDWAGEYENDFREVHSDYDAAAKHVADGRLKELQLIHGDEQSAHQAFMQEMLGLVAECKQRNLDPAETVYNIAKTRGYKNTVAIDNAAEKAQTIKRGQAASKSLGSVGKSEPSELSYEAINAIKNPEQRYAAFEKMRAREQEAAKYG